MKWLWATACAFLVGASGAAELPQGEDDPENREVEPELLIKGRDPDGSPQGLARDGAPDIDRLTTSVARAKRSAASAERLWRGGIIAKVEAEKRVLAVVVMEAELEDARWQQAKHDLLEARRRGASAAEIAAAEAAVPETERVAKVAAERRQAALLEAAVVNLERQRKLLALGSGRRADVSRAEQKVADLKRQKD